MREGARKFLNGRLVIKSFKLAKSNTTVHAIKREFENKRMAWEHGLPVPQSFELVNIVDRPGIVFERIYGETLMERFIKQVVKRTNIEEEPPPLDENDFIRITAQTLSDIHSKTNLNMPSQRDILKHFIQKTEYLTAHEKEAIIHILDGLPIKQQLCHGDPNPGNIFIRDGKPVVIDWTSASIGNPEADLAEYIIMIRYAVLTYYLPSLPIEAVKYFDSIRESIIHIFVEEYSKLTGITYAEIDAWIVPIAARKLSSDLCQEERSLLLNEIKQRLNRAEETTI